MQTDTDDLEGALGKYLEKLDALGGIDIFFLEHRPEAEAASHLAYIKPDSGAITHENMSNDVPVGRDLPDDLLNPAPEYLDIFERSTFYGVSPPGRTRQTRNFVTSR